MLRPCLFLAAVGENENTIPPPVECLTVSPLATSRPQYPLAVKGEGRSSHPLICSARSLAPRMARDMTVICGFTPKEEGITEASMM